MSPAKYLLGAAVASAAIFAFACGGPDAPLYGGPNSLKGQSAPSAGASGASCGTVVSDMNCAVKWTTNIFPKVNGTWNCTGMGCHAAGGQSPTIPADPTTAYNALLSAAAVAGKPYLNPCSKDPTASAMACQTHASGACGDAMPPTNGIPAGDYADLMTWIQCGAPSN